MKHPVIVLYSRIVVPGIIARKGLLTIRIRGFRSTPLLSIAPSTSFVPTFDRRTDGLQSVFSSFFYTQLSASTNFPREGVCFTPGQWYVISKYIYISIIPLVGVLNFNVRFLANDAVATIPLQT